MLKVPVNKLCPGRGIASAIKETASRGLKKLESSLSYFQSLCAYSSHTSQSESKQGEEQDIQFIPWDTSKSQMKYPPSLIFSA